MSLRHKLQERGASRDRDKLLGFILLELSKVDNSNGDLLDLIVHMESTGLTTMSAVVNSFHTK